MIAESQAGLRQIHQTIELMDDVANVRESPSQDVEAFAKMELIGKRISDG
jgi:hypothetical protein